jgi:N-acetylneuraminic acid mutarotase
VSHGALLVAGGSNFPDKKPWEGGKKSWHDTVYVLENPAAKWKVAGRLPMPWGYGVGATYKNSLICAGGSNQSGHHNAVVRLEWSGGKLSITQLPPLPRAIANCSGTLVGDVLYVAGGIDEPESTTTSRYFWQMDLAAREPKWTELPAWPGNPRMLAVAAELGGKFYLIGGVDLTAGPDGKPKRRDLTDSYCYDPTIGKGWRRIADLPHSVVAGPTPAPDVNENIYLLGGDDGLQANLPPAEHAGFFKTSLRYDAKTDKWSTAGEITAPRATVPVARWNNAWVLPSGEVRPGVRSPEVWQWTP